VSAPAPPSAGHRPNPALLWALALAGWALIGFCLFHWGATWALDLRVYRVATSNFWHHGSPYSATLTSSDLPFTDPPFALLFLSPLAFGSLGLVKALWWLVNEAALVALLTLALTTALGLPRRQALLLAAAGGAVATLAVGVWVSKRLLDAGRRVDAVLALALV
jgi:hypothetical protein